MLLGRERENVNHKRLFRVYQAAENPLGISANGFAALECFHIAGFALAIGMTALVDFRLLGFGLLKESPARISRSFDLWTVGGLIVAGLFGFVDLLNRSGSVLPELVVPSKDGGACSGHCFPVHGSSQGTIEATVARFRHRDRGCIAAALDQLEFRRHFYCGGSVRARLKPMVKPT